jgi:hypothetical protein
MAKQIKRQDISEEDLFKSVRESAEKTLKTLSEMNTVLQTNAKILSGDIKNATTASAKGINDLVAATEKANKMKGDAVKIDQETIKIKQQLLKAEELEEKVKQQKLKTEAQVNREKERQAKASEKAAKAAQNEASAYKQLEKNTRELKNQSKELGAQMLKLEQSGKKNSEEYRKLATQYKQVTTAAQQGDAQLKKLDKTVGDNFRNVGNYQSALGGLNKVLGAFGIAFGINQIKSFVSSSTELFRVQEQAVAQVETGLRSTGNAVGFTLDELKAKASAFQKESLFGDEQILKDLTAVMLTFTNVTGESFDRAQQAALDLSTRMDGDLKGAAVQLGKALNDPIKGMTALSKSGVSFTAQQKEQIKTLAESGKLMEAQTIILDEMSHQFGGSAKAANEANGGVKQLSMAWGDAKEELGKLLTEVGGSINLLGGLTAAVEWLSKNWKTLLLLIPRLIVYYIAYRNQQKLTAAAQYLFNGGLMNTIKSIPQMIKGLSAASFSFKALGTAMKSIPLVAVVAGLVELALWLGRSSDATDELRDAEQKLNDELDRGNELRKKRVSEQAKIDTQVAIRDKLSQEQLKNLKAELEAEIALSEAKEASIKVGNQNIKSFKASNTAQKQLTKVKDDLKKKELELKNASGSRQTAIRKEIDALKAQQKIWEGQVVAETISNNLKKEGSELSDDEAANLKKRREQLALIDPLIKAEVKNTKSHRSAQKELKTELKEVNEFLSKQSELLAKIEEIKIDKAIAEKANAIAEALSNAVAAARETGEILSGAEGFIDDITGEVVFGDQFTDVEALVNEKFEIEKALLEQQQAERLRILEQQYQDQGQLELDNLIKERDELLAQANITKAEIAKIEKDFEDKREIIRLNDLQRNADLELERIILAEDTAEKLIEIEKRRQGELDEVNNQLIDAQIVFADNQIKSSEKVTENEKKNTDYRIALVNALADAQKAASDKRIKLIDQEIAAAQKQFDYFQGLAANGNISAKESLAEQQRLIVEANKQKEKEMRRQARIELAVSAYNAYQKNVEDKSVKNPLAKTITDITLLSQFIQNLPAFFDGTEDTGKNGQGIDGKGGFQAILHPNERVLTKEQNQMIGSLTNNELAKIAMEYNTGSLMRKGDGAMQIGGAWQTAAIVQKLDSLEKAIKTKPETNIELGEIVSGAMEIVKTTRKGNDVIYNRYRIK